MRARVRVCVYVDVRMCVCATPGVSQSGVCLRVTYPSAAPSRPNMCVRVFCVCVTPSPSLQICNRICGSGQCLSTENLQGFTSAQNYIRDSRWGLARGRTLSLHPSSRSLHPLLRWPFSLAQRKQESSRPWKKTGFQALRSAFCSLSALLCYFPKSMAPRESSPVTPWEIRNWAVLISVVFFAWDIAKAYSLR